MQSGECKEENEEGGVENKEGGKENKEVKTTRDRGFWTRTFFLLLFIVVTILIIINLHFIVILKSQRGQCGKAICCSELNRLQSEIRWLKAKQQNLTQFYTQRFNDQEVKFDEVENNQHNYSIVLVLFVVIIVIVFVFLLLENKDDNGNRTFSISKGRSSTSEGTSHALQRLNRVLKNEPVIVHFTWDWSPDDENLAKSFLTDRPISPMLISEESNIYDINGKLVFLFVKYNERQIILEDDCDTSYLRQKTVKIIENTQGKAVVIYMLHGDSRNLEDGCLYSRKLTSININPTLKKLSKEECVISTDKKLSKFQIQHLKKLCKKYLSAEF